MVLLPQPGFDPHFLWYLVNSESFWEKGGAAQPYVRVHETLERRLPLPPQGQQRSIADFLDRETARIGRVISQKRLLLKRLIERRGAVIFRAAIGLLDAKFEWHDPSVPWSREVRKPWPAAKIKHVAQLGTGHTPSRSQPELWKDCTIPWITTGEIQQVRDDRVEIITETREKISELGLAHSAAVLHPAGTVVR